MSILAVNLKHLYQRPAVWFWHAMIVTQLVGPVMIIIDLLTGKHRSNSTVFAFYLVGSVFLGFETAMLQRELQSKPFTFCLPGQQEIPRKFIMYVGLAGNFLLGLLFAAYPGLSTSDAILAIIAAGFMGMIVYLLGVLTIMGLQRGQVLLGLLYPAILVFAYTGGVQFIIRAIVDYSWTVVAVGLLACRAAWVYLGRRELARENCGKIVAGFFSAWNSSRMAAFRRQQMGKEQTAIERTISAGVEGYFLRRMEGCSYAGTMRSIWGAVYTSISPTFSTGKQWLSGVTVLVLMLLWFGYMGNRFINMLFVWPVFAAMGARFAAETTMVLTCGRRERFFGSVAQAVCICSLMTILAVLAALGTIKLAEVMPAIGFIDNRPMKFEALDVQLWYLPVLVVPLGFFIRIMTRGRPFLMMMPIILIFTTAMAWIPFMQRNIPPGAAVGLAVGAWAMFLGATWRACMRRQIGRG